MRKHLARLSPRNAVPCWCSVTCSSQKRHAKDADEESLISASFRSVATGSPYHIDAKSPDIAESVSENVGYLLEGNLSLAWEELL